MKRLFFFTVCLYLVSCGTQPVRPSLPQGSLLQRAQWETKAVIRDLKENKSHSIDIDILGEYPNKLRMEVSALMGTHVASLVLNGDEVHYALYPRKKFFYGKATEDAFLPLMNMPLHPYNFLNIAYDVPMRGIGWVCTKDPNNLPTECFQANRQIKVQWLDRTPEGQKKVLITAPSFEMKWLFKTPQTEVQFKNETFVLEAPSDFKTIQLK
ncbi:MAG: hypothetical protein ACXWRE_05670 [Pseudobdellovibrionaceae bacterium]